MFNRTEAEVGVNDEAQRIALGLIDALAWFEPA
jgi:hypothetical protein